MHKDASEQYPGKSATVGELLSLADAYRDAARLLEKQGPRRHTIARAPLHLAAIHAIELYLNALLLHADRQPCEVRALHHCLQKRADEAKGAGLQLRKKTHDHLVAMGGKREYVVVRYEPDLRSAMSNISRLMTTLDEVSEKVALCIGNSGVQEQLQ